MRRIITADEVRKLAESGEQDLVTSEGDLITPAALDEARNRQMSVRRIAGSSDLHERTNNPSSSRPSGERVRTPTGQSPVVDLSFLQRGVTEHPSVAALEPSRTAANHDPDPSGTSTPLAHGSQRVAVLGAGHGGLATAGHLTLKGIPTTLFSFFDHELAPVREAGGIQLLGDVQGFAEIDRLTTSIDDALHDAHVIIVVYPALVHSALATLMAGALRDGQLVLLTPGRTGGALEFARTLKRFAVRARIYLAEAQSFMYAAEGRAPGAVTVAKEKRILKVSSLPASDNEIVIPRLQRIYHQIEAAENVLETSLNNIGPVVHPAPMILNLPAIERAAAGQKVRHYRELITKSICDLYLEPIDAEKVAITRALGLDAWTALDWYERSYNVVGKSLYDVLQRNPYYAEFAAPTNFLGYHHILDEVPNSLVAIACLGTLTGTPTPTINAVVDMASAACGFDFRQEGRTLQRLGIEGLDVDSLRQYVDTGQVVGHAVQNGRRAFDAEGRPISTLAFIQDASERAT